MYEACTYRQSGPLLVTCTLDMRSLDRTTEEGSSSRKTNQLRIFFLETVNRKKTSIRLIL